MMLSDTQADRIRILLKDRNQLTREYSRAEILAANYLCRFLGDEVIAFVELKKVQWYQAEICHLTVAPAHERQGHAKALIEDAEKSARASGCRLLQCTIREHNYASQSLFVHFGFRVVGRFYNQVSGNNVDVLQKVLDPPR